MKSKLIFDVLAQPAVKFGRKVAVYDTGSHVHALDFGPLPNGLVGLSPTPWRHAWATCERKWFHLDKVTKQCLIVDEDSLAFWRDSGGIYPGTWIIDDDERISIIGGNVIGISDAGISTSQSSGFQLYLLQKDSLTVLNQQPLPYLIWTAWKQNDFIVLAGMTHRNKSICYEGNDFESARPVIVCCDLSAKKWEELDFDYASISDRLKTEHIFPGAKFESWIGSQALSDGSRILIAGIVGTSFSFLDERLCLSSRPIADDYVALAFLSYVDGSVIGIEKDARFIHTIRTPDRNIFVIARNIVVGNHYPPRLDQLFIIDPLSYGLELQKMQVEGVTDNDPVVGFSATYFGEEGFFGCISTANKHYFVRSGDSLRWMLLCTSDEIECHRIDDLKASDD